MKIELDLDLLRVSHFNYLDITSEEYVIYLCVIKRCVHYLYMTLLHSCIGFLLHNVRGVEVLGMLHGQVICLTTQPPFLDISAMLLILVPILFIMRLVLFCVLIGTTLLCIMQRVMFVMTLKPRKVTHKSRVGCNLFPPGAFFVWLLLQTLQEPGVIPLHQFLSSRTVLGQNYYNSNFRTTNKKSFDINFYKTKICHIYR